MRNPFAALRGGTIRAGLAITLCASATWLAIGAPTSPKIIKKPDYTKEIRPILGDHCLKCHGLDGNARKGNLRLDLPITAAQAKEVARRIALPASSSLHMPPMDEPSQPTASQKALLTAWTRTGAQVDKHWAFVAPKRPAVPKVSNPQWVRTPIDAYILEKLDKVGMKPSPDADRRTWLRRATLDLTGLPPTPVEVDRFLADTRPNAYAVAADRLLASPRYGERMAADWLDGARYADSNGYQADYERFQYRWRDWVIDAFNANKPYDQFTVEQLAGDMLPNPTTEQVIATGFNRNHRVNTEGGVIAEEWRIETVIDRVETTSAVWLGMTFGCARCHDHKYDPVSQKDFYSVFAFFNNIAESGTGVEAPENHPPLIKSPTRDQNAMLAKLDTQIDAVNKSAKSAEPDFLKWASLWEASRDTSNVKPSWLPAGIASASATSGAKLTANATSAIVVTGTNPAKDSYTVILDAADKDITGVRIEVMPGVNGYVSRHFNGNFVLTGISASTGGKDAPFGKAVASFQQDGHDVSGSIDGNGDTPGWAIYPKTRESHDARFAFAKPVTAVNGKLVVRLDFGSIYENHALQNFRISLTTGDPLAGASSDAGLAVLQIPAEKRTPAQVAALHTYIRANTNHPARDADRKLAQLTNERKQVLAMVPTTMVMGELEKPRECRVLVRGAYDKPGDVVTADIPSALGTIPAGQPKNRLSFARWVASRENPLTARVAVNRVWERLFGRGLVETTEDFGVRCAPPSHPELLDWMAVEFMDSGWDLKKLHKTLVLSSTYRQSSVITPDAMKRDPENHLLARGPRFRLSGEAIRDQALAICDLLVDKVGGPSVRPYQPAGFWDELSVYGNLRNYKADSGEGLYRRSIYTIWKRTAGPPQMAIFDVPGREACRVRRSRTNTPLQALVLLNDPTFVEAARVLAQKAITEGKGSDVGILNAMFRRALGRVASKSERDVLLEGTALRRLEYQQHPEDANKLVLVGAAKRPDGIPTADLAAWMLTASIILNTDELVTKE